MTSSTQTQMIQFNFGYIKSKAKAGAWRRGYGYLKEKQVKDISFAPDGVISHVKGNYKEAYTIHLKFEPENISPTCDCPLSEEWCKHAVAVGLECVEQKLWEEFFDLPFEDEIALAAKTDFLGRFRFQVKKAKATGDSGKKGKNARYRGKQKPTGGAANRVVLCANHRNAPCRDGIEVELRIRVGVPRGPVFAEQLVELAAPHVASAPWRLRIARTELGAQKELQSGQTFGAGKDQLDAGREQIGKTKGRRLVGVAGVNAVQPVVLEQPNACHQDGRRLCGDDVVRHR